MRTIPTVRATSSSGSRCGDYTLVVSILSDKNADEMLRELRRAGPAAGRDPVVVGSCALSSRTSPGVARAHFDHVEAVESPVAALARAYELGEPVLVTGSLYLLGDLAAGERR